MIRKLHFVVLFLFGTVLIRAQQPFPADIPINVRSAETPAGITEELDQLSAESPLYYHAKDFTVSQHMATLRPMGKNYYYRISAPNLGIRAFLDIKGFNKRDTLFVLNSQGLKEEYVCSENLYQKEWASKIYTDDLILLYKSNSRKPPQVEILDYSLEVPKNTQQTDDFGHSGACEVNINCSEGNNFQDVKKSIVRILIRHEGVFTWCTGTLIGNTARDCRLLLLTAEHCGLDPSNKFVSQTDMAKWVFFFNYESKGCSSPASEFQLDFEKVTGAQLLARSEDNGGDNGSDFILMELNQAPPPNYQPYFAGWSRVNSAPAKGNTIHHPQGDIKKISKFNAPAISGKYGNVSDDTHWIVTWNATKNGHGVTEGGSSGSPLLDTNKLITGVLTGGNAKCTNLNGLDYFGKISYSWTGNGTVKTRQLAPWLDPVNQGQAVYLAGGYCGDSAASSNPKAYAFPTFIYKGGQPLYIKGGGITDELEAQIFDVSGKLRYQTESFILLPEAAKEIEMDHYANGIYFIRILANDKPMVTKIVIAR